MQIGHAQGRDSNPVLAMSSMVIDGASNQCDITIRVSPSLARYHRGHTSHNHTNSITIIRDCITLCVCVCVCMCARVCVCVCVCHAMAASASIDGETEGFLVCTSMHKHRK